MHEEKKVHCQYFTSAFIHCTADKLKKALLTEIQNLNPKSLIQISIDGPNVNIASAKKVDTDRDATGLINTGSGSLHIIHGAFKSWVEATPWKI